ncbi:MAG TPA: hypothetical protein VKA21_05800 [Candidatus Binatia bacterium]|nr:hypothetical protein [Candidatus Binatia bacterium]
MGAWGTAIFSDDTARDVRDEFRDHVGDGLSGPAATDRLLQAWRDTLADPDDGPVFWLALASTQWKCGRLEPRVLERALAVIANGAALRRWADDPKSLAKRRAALGKLEEQLRSPAPAEKRIPKRFRNHCEWEVGEVIAYRLRSGRWSLLRIIAFHSDRGGTSPICELLDWVGDRIPSREEVVSLPVRLTGPDRRPSNQLTRFMIGRTSERELPRERVKRLGMKLEPAQQPPVRRGGMQVSWSVIVFSWRFLDAALERDFGFA